jgi:hypothetical protein
MKLPFNHSFIIISHIIIIILATHNHRTERLHKTERWMKSCEIMIKHQQELNGYKKFISKMMCTSRRSRFIFHIIILLIISHCVFFACNSKCAIVDGMKIVLDSGNHNIFVPCSTIISYKITCNYVVRTKNLKMKLLVSHLFINEIL